MNAGASAGNFVFGGNWHSISWTEIERCMVTTLVNTTKKQGNKSDKFPSLSLHQLSTLDHIVREIYIASHK